MTRRVEKKKTGNGFDEKRLSSSGSGGKQNASHVKKTTRCAKGLGGMKGRKTGVKPKKGVKEKKKRLVAERGRD